MKRKFLYLCILKLALLNSFAHTQVGISRKVLVPTFSPGAEFRTWQKTVGDSTENISQYNFPIVFKVPVTEDIAFDIIGSAIISSAKKQNLRGVRDIKVSGVGMFADDTIMFNVGLNLPIGKNRLDSEGTAVSLRLSDSALGFKYNRLGEGFDVNLGCGVAKAFGAATLGAGIGYLIKGKYEYFQEKDSEYKPGNRLNITGGFDLLLNRLFLRTDLTYTAHQFDKLNSSEVFKEGVKLAVEETFFISTEGFSLLMSARYTSRGKNEILSSMVGEGGKRYGAHVNINGVIRSRLSDFLILKGVGEGLFIIAEEGKQNDARVFGFGIGAIFQFMGMSCLDITGKYYTGYSDQAEVKLRGFGGTANFKLTM